MASRNQREGKYIAGWCFNPPYKLASARPDETKIVQKKRAGKHYNLTRIVGFNDQGYIIPGVTYVRTIREGAFE